jgi:hypothetical protein
VNNNFLVVTAHPLALRYNGSIRIYPSRKLLTAHCLADISPLENMHVSKAFEIMLSPDRNIMLVGGIFLASQVDAHSLSTAHGPNSAQHVQIGCSTNGTAHR